MLWILILIVLIVWIIKDYKAVKELKRTRDNALAVENDSQHGIIVLGTSRKSTV